MRSQPRRELLKAVVHAGIPGVAGGMAVSTGADAGATMPSLQPRARQSLSSVREAVVDDRGETVYVATVDGFAIVDVSDPASPSVVTRVDDISGPERGPVTDIQDLSVSNDRLLVGGPAAASDGLAGFALYDVSDPTTPSRLAFYRRNRPSASGLDPEGEGRKLG